MLAWDNIAVKRIMIRTNSKINSHQSCYLHLTAIVQPLNVVRFQMWLGAQCKLLHHFSTCQVVAAPSINDDSTKTLLDHTLGLKQSVALILFSLLHLCTQHSLYHEALIVFIVFRSNMLLIFVALLIFPYIVSSMQGICFFI